MSEQALRVAQAAKSAAELQQYRQELHGEAKGRVNVTHGKQPTLESVLPARYSAAATFCVCVLLAGWGLHQSDTYMTVGSSLAYFLHQYGQHEQAVTNLMVEDLLKSLKADLARTAQPVDGTEPDDPADLSDDDYFIDITVQSCPYSDPEQGEHCSRTGGILLAYRHYNIVTGITTAMQAGQLGRLTACLDCRRRRSCK